MESKIAKAIRLSTQPVAVIRSETCPEGAVQFKEGVWGCVIALLNAAAKGKTAVFSEATTVCRGGRVGLGFGRFKSGIEYFLSVGGGPSDKPAEHYKKTPELARNYTETVPVIGTSPYVIFKPLSEVTEDDRPDAVIFLVNPDQLSGLATLANYDKPDQENVKIHFGAGCVQSILYPIYGQEKGDDLCHIGLTDPSARKCLPKDLLSFSIPYNRFLAMELETEGSFFDTDTWEKIAERI